MNAERKRLVGKVTVAVIILAMVMPVGFFVTGAHTSAPPTIHRAPANTFYQQNDIVRLANAEYDVDLGPRNLPAQLVIDRYDDRVSGYYLVKFNGPVDQAWLAELEAMGASIGNYVPYNTFMVKIDSATLPEVQSLPFVRSVDIYQPAFKIQQHLLDGVQLASGFNAADSLDFIKWSNLFDQARAIGTDPDRVVVNIMVHPGENPYNLAAMISKEGGKLLGISENSVRAEVGRSGIQALAFVNNVEYIMPHFEHQLMLADTAPTEQERVSMTTPIWSHGITGSGITIGIGDTGLNTDHEHFRDPAWGGASDWTGSSPAHRKVVGYHELGDNHIDYDGHGSHVSGIAAGNGDYVGSTNSNRFGMAYDAKISFCDVGRSDDGSGTNDNTLGGIPQDVKDMYTLTKGDGASIHSNSWGVPCTYDSDGDGFDDARTYSEGTYSEDALNSDWFMWDNKEFQILFSDGNDRGAGTYGGPAYNTTTTPPATAKNVISVAARCAATGWDDITSYSSWGGTLDGRLKPTIAATGDGTSSYAGMDSAGNDNNRDGNADTTYASMQGTSMASPCAAGDLALISQYYRDGWYPALASSPIAANGFVPSAALLKATMINGAEDSTAGTNANVAGHEYTLNGHTMDYPNTDQGWGMVNLENSLYFSGDAREMWIDDNQVGLITGQSREYKFNALAGQPLEITLVWTDYPGTTATWGALVNDLDLTVIDPLGEDYLGNNFGATSRESDPTDPAGYDHVNVEEVVLVKAPTAGEWTIRIDATNVPVGPQPYALVVTGDFDDGYGWVKFDKGVYAPGDTVTITVEDTNVATGSVNVNLVSSTGDSETVVCNEIAAGARVFQGTITTDVLTPVSSNGAISIEESGTLTATYSDASPVHDSVVTATTKVAGPAISDVYVTDISNTAAIVHWTTNEPATSQVYYGTTAALGSVTPLDTDMVLQHSVVVTGLSGFTNYYFDVESTSIGGVTTRDTNGGDHYMFTTVDNPDVLIVQEHSDIASSDQQVSDWRLSLGYYGWSFTVWETVKYGLPTLSALNSAKVVYWDVGEGYPQLGSEERALLQSWVGQAGQQKWYQTGQDIGWDMDAAAGGTDPDSTWYHNYMHATFNQDDADGGGGNEVAGQCWLIGTAHAISSSFPGNGGTQDLEQDIYGANRFWPDDITNDQGGQTPAPWDYNLHAGGGDCAGIAYEGTDYKLAYEAFAHAMIQDDGTFGTPGNVFGVDLNMDRATIADNTIIWLMGEDHPDVTVLDNNGQAEDGTWSGTRTITWSIANANTIDIQISSDGGQSYVVEASGLPGTSTSYSWDTTGYLNGEHYRIKVVGHGTNLVGFDESDANFTLDNGFGSDWVGPVIQAGSVGGSPLPVGQGHTLHIVATADDTRKGNSPISVVECYIDGTNPGDKVGNMLATDGAFDSPLEDAYLDYDVLTESVGTHTLYVRAQDAAGNWGGFESSDFYVVQGPPVVTINTPTTDEITSGSAYDITWTATDLNYPDNTLDIKVEYSPDGGSSWIVLEDGTDNNDGVYTWDTTTVADGVNYLVRISATNDFPLTEAEISEPFSVDNTADDQWHFQVEASGPFGDLDMKPVETTPNTMTTAALTTASQVLVGTWETPGTYDGDINGPWTFNIYGHVDYASPLEAYLYAVVKDGTGVTLDTTVNDDENVGAYTSSHMFTWTDTLAGTVSGQAIRVEVWLNVVTPSGGSGVSTYHPTDAGFSASFWDVDAMPPTGANLNTEYVFDATMETQASTSDDVRAVSVDPGAFDEIFTWCDVAIAEDPAIITQIDLTFEGQGAAATDFDLWVMDAGTWGATGDTIAVGANTDGTLTGSLTSGFSNYIQGGVLTWGVYQTDSSDLIRVDLLEVTVSYTVPDAAFTMEYDYGTTQSNVQPTYNPSGGPTYGTIDLTGFAAGDWAFVSFPNDVSGAVTTVLDDSVAGDGSTTWDIVKWYDATDPADPWKTYNPSKPAGLNDLTTIDNTMGVWIHLTANGGDQTLTLGVSGGYPAAAVSIPLYTGWNLVGYPSATARQADTTLPGQVDMIAVYDGAQPYWIRDVTDLTTVTMTEGNAYWVHVTADTTWNVNP